MKIAKNVVVTMNYTLKDDKGTVIDSSSENGPLSFIQGIGNIITGLEAKMEGKEKGDKFNCTISPVDGYGEADPNLIQKVERSQFGEGDTLEVGMMFEVGNDEQTFIARVISLDDQNVTLDANHPMAGQTLNFDIEILNVRAAEANELAHGHAHGEGGHHH
ncbi:MAG: peptidylprolyl isomerase [Bdellovibrionales bacterium CG12_big_fil_rev_8_21_14_0_65_38_15]|nr:MAG: peptidylprolyl isomerase [Bdellovibrionales bacterium CG22_combo_CG10-13_8_21_14_all_38_13]PIQ53343.1 MAG: peptidylprolyl isomerase [Bdellovibrionales bacterium CG12_big_fil_rev_8_21_14_0_65_38_15]PIR30293.1 MAG: peptidylprolyl isomerase [Bdellovibrionales bacterium CG11_big_fil_rev_8_21_14_0_20_38_13]